jgi:hypothetical protein
MANNTTTQQLQVGKFYYGVGLDMRCRPTVECSQLVEIINETRVVIKCVDGIQVILDAEDLYESKEDVQNYITENRHKWAK